MQTLLEMEVDQETYEALTISSKRKIMEGERRRPIIQKASPGTAP